MANHAGTHSSKYVDDVIEIMQKRNAKQDMINGMEILWQRIKAGEYL